MATRKHRPRGFPASKTPVALLSAYAKGSPEMSMPLALLSAYAPQYFSKVMLFLSMFNLVPKQLLNYFIDAVKKYWNPKRSKLSLVFRKKAGMYPNQMFDAAEAFLCTKVNPDSNSFIVSKNAKEDNINIKFARSEAIEDSFEGISLSWRYVIVPPQIKLRGEVGGGDQEKKFIELNFNKEYKDTIINSYLPWILKRVKELENLKKVVRIHNLQYSRCYDDPRKESLILEHPSTFDTLAMDPKVKKMIIDDLDLFLRRKDFYRKVGKAWKRGYLLYGPPGTGKSSLIAAMSNYLKFDIYDLQLNSVESDSSLKKMMLNTSNRSMIVIEDIDCSIQVHDRKEITVSSNQRLVKPKSGPKFSLSGLLNFIDGLWSCCGDERIIIFTTNHKEKLDPALLRPGRMDVHIHMSYLTFEGFKTLAANYLNIHDDHWRFGEIKELINGTNVTPAEVAEELMKSENQEVVLEGLVNFLKQKETAKKKRETAKKERIEKGEAEVRESKKGKLASDEKIESSG